MKKTLKFTGIFLIIMMAAAQLQAETKTVTTEQTTVQTNARVKKSSPMVQTTTSTATTTTEQLPNPTPVTEETLKKISNTLCTPGFRAYVGTERKNICSGKVSPPDIAYSCIWDQKGKAAYAPTEKGPCNYDFTVHQGSVIVTKENFPSSPPLSYGLEAECCVRQANGAPFTTTSH